MSQGRPVRCFYMNEHQLTRNFSHAKMDYMEAGYSTSRRSQRNHRSAKRALRRANRRYNKVVLCEGRDK